MITKKNISRVLVVFALLVSTLSFSQKVTVYKIDNLLKRIHNNSDTLYIVNFWATWCKPCVAELPDFEKINTEYKTQKVKVLLVSMDFKEDVSKKLKPFLQKNNYASEVVLLDELNGNEFIDKVSKQWGGAIPATLFTKNNNSINDFFEKKLHYEFLVEQITKYK
jgi:thiol-disulfide isomerase/thioredoxin